MNNQTFICKSKFLFFIFHFQTTMRPKRTKFLNGNQAEYMVHPNIKMMMKLRGGDKSRLPDLVGTAAAAPKMATS